MPTFRNDDPRCYSPCLGKEDEEEEEEKEEEEEALLIRKILLSHDPDGRRVDSNTLLWAMENVMCYAANTFNTTSASQTLLEALAKDTDISNIQVGSSNEALGQTIHKISCEIRCKCIGDGDLHMRAMKLFDLLEKFMWDAKVVFVLVAFVLNYGELCLMIQAYHDNPLAKSIAMLKQLPKNIGIFKPRFKALSLLVKTMVDVTKCIIEFESLPMHRIKLDDNAYSMTKSQIYLAVYWIIRSTLTSASLFTDVIAMNHEQVSSSSTTIAMWELASLVYKVSLIFRRLRRQVDLCQQLLEDELHKKLLVLFEETHIDNQEVLSTLFSLKDDKPFKDGSSQAKLGVSELVNKVTVLLVSKPEILPVEELLVLVQQTCNTHPNHRDSSERNYEIVWIPLSSSDTWTHEEEEAFGFLSNTLPLYSVRQPWLLSSEVVNYFKEVWNFVDEPLMVVLDRYGRVISTNAIHMVYIWGTAVAYPFSISREEQLWKEVQWSIKLIIDQIDPLLSKQVEEGSILCLYGSSDLAWIRDFISIVKKMNKAGFQLQIVYVGKRKSGDQHVRNIISALTREKLSSSLSYPRMHFFWLRLESIKRSRLNLEKGGIIEPDDLILQNVMSLINLDNSEKSWALIGEGLLKDTVQLQGRKAIECLKLFQVWGENIDKFGFLQALRRTLEPPLFFDPCYGCSSVLCVEKSCSDDGGSVFCEECKHPMKKLIVYQCNPTI